uniref:Uncharacterized protein n=1 Tax=Odontella aurita TaxID=265563 RepID=A0A7S4NC14_9STRA|mmetsp:Transcript_56363/g.168707  ORF Transcript_56363/g.168707 Transcript_56363/m.168707 type:complete len:294 (+) Transcript_56363:369-1250(+)
MTTTTTATTMTCYSPNGTRCLALPAVAVRGRIESATTLASPRRPSPVDTTGAHATAAAELLAVPPPPGGDAMMSFPETPKASNKNRAVKAKKKRKRPATVVSPRSPPKTFCYVGRMSPRSRSRGLSVVPAALERPPLSPARSRRAKGGGGRSPPRSPPRGQQRQGNVLFDVPPWTDAQQSLAVPPGVAPASSFLTVPDLFPPSDERSEVESTGATPQLFPSFRGMEGGGVPMHRAHRDLLLHTLVPPPPPPTMIKCDDEILSDDDMEENMEDDDEEDLVGLQFVRFDEGEIGV